MKDYKQRKLFKTDFNFTKQLEKKLHFTLDLEGYSMKGLLFFCKTNCIFSPCLHELLQQDQQYLQHEEKLELCWKINTIITQLCVYKWCQNIYINNSPRVPQWDSGKQPNPCVHLNQDSQWSPQCLYWQRRTGSTINSSNWTSTWQNCTWMSTWQNSILST